MSDYLIQSTDDIALAIRENSSSPTDTTSILQAIRNEIARVADKPCCPVPYQPQPIYDCETNTVTGWIDIDGSISPTFPGFTFVFPPSSPGGTNPDRPPQDPGGVLIMDDFSPPPTFTDSDPRYGEPIDETKFDGTNVTLGTVDERCRKANVFVYMTWEMLDTMSTLLSAAEWAAGGALTSLSGRGMAKVGFYFTSKTLGVVERFISVAEILSWVSALTAIFDNLGGSWLDLTLGFDDAIDDLVCAIYNATSQRDLKQRWDAAVNDHYQWFSPPGVLIKTFMSDKWTTALMDADLVAKDDALGYNRDCSMCETTMFEVQDLYYSSDSDVAAVKLVVFPGGLSQTQAPALVRYTHYDIGTPGSEPANCWMTWQSGQRVRHWGSLDTTSIQEASGQRLLFFRADGSVGYVRTYDGQWVTVPECLYWCVGLQGIFGHTTHPSGTMFYEIEGL
jgi:hypothetical protein